MIRGLCSSSCIKGVNWRNIRWLGTISLPELGFRGIDGSERIFVKFFSLFKMLEYAVIIYSFPSFLSSFFIFLKSERESLRSILCFAFRAPGWSRRDILYLILTRKPGDTNRSYRIGISTSPEWKRLVSNILQWANSEQKKSRLTVLAFLDIHQRF